MYTESFADSFGILCGNTIETAAAYYCFCKIISHKPRLREYAVIIALSLIFPINAIVFTLMMIISGTVFSKSHIATNIAAAAITETIFQLSFSLWGAVAGIISGISNFKEIPYFGTTAMLSGELFSLMTAVCILDKLSDILSRKWNDKAALMLFLPLPIIFISGYYINQSILGNTVSYSSMPTLGNSLYTAIAVLLGIIGVFAFLFSSDKLRRLEYANGLQEKYIDEAREKLDKTKAYRHDCKNHLTVLSELVKMDEAENAKQYLSDLEKRYAFSPDYRTGSTAADIIIADKFSAASYKNIAVECTLNIPAQKFNDVDICTLLANALDNAVHGCEKACGNKYIMISGFEQGGIFLIEIENSFDGNTSFTCGTGIDNMNKAANKYGGSVHLSCEGNVFRTSIILNISQH